jgi:signal transduction histidine kinase/ligand-binding sensor domain-containing protein
MTLKRLAEFVLASVLGPAIFALITIQPLRSQVRATASTPMLRAQEDPHTIKLPIVDGHDLRFQRVSLTQGLSQRSVSSITQDNQGFMWFGTQYGLNRYDGYKFKVFAREPGRSNSLSGVFVRSLFKDRDGTLWVGCDQSLDKFDPLTETFTHFSIKTHGESGPGATVMHLSQDRNGVLWLSTRNGLYSLEPTSGRIARYAHDPNNPRSLSSSYIRSTGEDRDGTLWVASTEGLDAFNPITGTVSIHIPAHTEGREFSFFEDSFGVFWVYHAAVGGSLSVYDRRTNKLTHYSFDPTPGSKGDTRGFVYMLEDRDRNLWLATTNDGLYKFDRQHQQFLRYRNEANNAESLADDQLLNLFQDREGNIWVGPEQMAPNYFSTRPTPFEKFVHQPGTVNNLAASLVSSIYEDRKGILWISSSSSLNRINRKTGENRVVFRGANDEIHTMMEDSAGALWAGTAAHGIQGIDQATGQYKGAPSPVVESSNADRRLVARLLADKDGSIWASTWDGLRHFDLARQRYTLYKPDPQKIAEFYGMAQDARGMLWLGSRDGLYRFDPATGQFKVYTHNPADPHSVSDSQVVSVYFDKSGTMWLGTQDGLDKFDPKTDGFEIYRDRDGLPGNAVNCILGDSHDNLWISTNNGLSKFDPNTRRFRNYSVADGISGPDLTGWGACFKTRSGEMFFGGFSGATAFYPDNVVDSKDVPQIVLTGFSLAGVPVEVGPRSLLQRAIAFAEGVTLTHRQNIFSIEFSALSYLNPAATRYRYRLEGLDQDWQQADIGERQVSYTTLPPNKYTFRVQGSIRGGPWGEPGTALQITVLPPWWNTWWFRMLYTAAILLLLWTAFRLHLRQIAQQYNMRMAERLAERNRIARELHDTLLQGFQGLMLLFQVVMDSMPANTPPRRMMEQAMDRADQALMEGRQSVQDLREDATAGGDLSGALGHCGEVLTQDHHIQFNLSVTGTPRLFDPALCKEAYDIGREAMTNAFRHAQAAKIETEIAYENTGVRLRIRDNGCGIDQKIVEDGRVGHWGLRGMRERAHAMGAELNIRSHPGAGTEVELTIPAEVAYPDSIKKSFWRRIYPSSSGNNGDMLDRRN